MKKVNTRVMKAIRNTKGRFFGLYTTQGTAMNAQLMGETDNYVNVYDRNAGVSRRLAKPVLLVFALQLKTLVKFPNAQKELTHQEPPLKKGGSFLL